LSLGRFHKDLSTRGEVASQQHVDTVNISPTAETASRLNTAIATENSAALHRNQTNYADAYALAAAREQMYTPTAQAMLQTRDLQMFNLDPGRLMVAVTPGFSESSGAAATAAADRTEADIRASLGPNGGEAAVQSAVTRGRDLAAYYSRSQSAAGEQRLMAERAQREGAQPVPLETKNAERAQRQGPQLQPLAQPQPEAALASRDRQPSGAAQLAPERQAERQALRQPQPGVPSMADLTSPLAQAEFSRPTTALETPTEHDALSTNRLTQTILVAGLTMGAAAAAREAQAREQFRQENSVQISTAERESREAKANFVYLVGQGLDPSKANDPAHQADLADARTAVSITSARLQSLYGRTA
jgi:hypothetical protein